MDIHTTQPLRELAALIPLASSLTWRAIDANVTTLDLYVDDDHQREVIRLRLYRRNCSHTVTRQFLYDYDEARHCWQTFGAESRRLFDTRRGEKALRQAIATAFESMESHGHEKRFTAYARPRGSDVAT